MSAVTKFQADIDCNSNISKPSQSWGILASFILQPYGGLVMCVRSWLSLFQLVACRLHGTDPSFEPVMVYQQLWLLQWTFRRHVQWCRLYCIPHKIFKQLRSMFVLCWVSWGPFYLHGSTIIWNSNWNFYYNAQSENAYNGAVYTVYLIPDSKVPGANMGPTWVLPAPDGPHVGPMNLAIRDDIYKRLWYAFVKRWIYHRFLM